MRFHPGLACCMVVGTMVLVFLAQVWWQRAMSACQLPALHSRGTPESVPGLCAAFDCLSPHFDAWPVTAEMRRRAEFWGDSSRLQRLMGRLQQGKPVKVSVLGGSFTAGHELTPGWGGADFRHAWPAVLERQLRRVWPHVSVDNVAKGGRSSDAWFADEAFWVSQLLHPPDMMLFEMGVNDQMFGPNVSDSGLHAIFTGLIGRALLQFPDTAIMAVEAFRLAAHNQADACGNCPLSCDDPRVKRPKDIWFCPAWWDVAEIHQVVLRELAVPFFSYRDLVWPKYAEPPAELGKFWNGLSHPDQAAHTLVGLSVADMFFRFRELWHTAKLPTPTRAAIDVEGLRSTLDGMGFCEHTSTAYHALGGQDKFAALPGSNVQAWRFYADVVDKPGWIANWPPSDPAAGTGDPVVSFQLTVGSKGRVKMEYLQSYHGMGAADVWFDDDKGKVVRVDAFTAKRFSTTTFRILEVAPGQHVMHIQLVRAEVPPEAPLGDAHAVTRGNKFKITALTAC